MGMILFGDIGDKPMQAQNINIEVSWSNDEPLQAQNFNIEVYEAMMNH